MNLGIIALGLILVFWVVARAICLVRKHRDEENLRIKVPPRSRFDKPKDQFKG